jgi:hypothetical protein
MEGRGLAKGNLPQQNASRTPSRTDAPSALERVRQAAGKDKKLRFTALLHHIYNLDTLRMAYFRLKKEAAPGVDGETWQHYGEQLEGNLQDLADRLKRGAYRAKPVRRVYIPKADGRQRPLGVTALEDKIVQRAAVAVLNDRLVGVQVERDDDRAGAVRRRKRAGLPPARRQPERGVQQLRLGRRERGGELAQHLRVGVQRLARLAPVLVRQCGPPVSHTVKLPVGRYDRAASIAASTAAVSVGEASDTTTGRAPAFPTRTVGVELTPAASA